MEPHSSFVRARPTVPGISALFGYDISGQFEGPQLGVPSGTITIVFSLDNPVEVAQDADRWRRRQTQAHDALVAGLDARPTYLRQPTRQRGVQVAMHPLAARRLLGMPAGELQQRTWEAASVLGDDEVGKLRQRLRELRSWPHRLAAVETYFAGRTAFRPLARSEVTETWRQLARPGPAIPVSEIAAGTCLSQRQLSKLVARELGLGPKALGRLLRFDRALAAIGSQIRAGRVPVLAAVAADNGYFDQSHMARDFLQFTDRSPSRFVAEEFRNFQAGGHQPRPESMP